MIITVSREYGSGGHDIGEKLAALYDLPVLDKNILDELAVKHGFNVDLVNKFDEKPKNLILSRRVRGYSNSLEEAVAELEFNHIREKAESGESFLVVGRCAETILKGRDDVYSIFIMGDMKDKVQRTIARGDATPEDVEKVIARQNNRRKNYHNYYCTVKWGDSRNYDICINSSRLGIDGTVSVLKNTIDIWLEKNNR